MIEIIVVDLFKNYSLTIKKAVRTLTFKTCRQKKLHKYFKCSTYKKILNWGGGAGDFGNVLC